MSVPPSRMSVLCEQVPFLFFSPSLFPGLEQCLEHGEDFIRINCLTECVSLTIKQHKIHASIFLIIQRQDIQKIFQRVKHVHDTAQHLLSLNEDGKSLNVTTLFRSHQKSLIYGHSQRYLSTWPSSQHPKQLLVNVLIWDLYFWSIHPRGGIQDYPHPPLSVALFHKNTDSF